eukprot:11971483-Alexandrium_andersonii.AAC.1
MCIRDRGRGGPRRPAEAGGRPRWERHPPQSPCWLASGPEGPGRRGAREANERPARCRLWPGTARFAAAGTASARQP